MQYPHSSAPAAVPGRPDFPSANTPDRPELLVGNAGVMTDWLMTHAGTGPLAALHLARQGLVWLPWYDRQGNYTGPTPAAPLCGVRQLKQLSTAELTGRVQTAYRVLTAKRDPGVFPARAASNALGAPDWMPNVRPLSTVCRHTEHDYAAGDYSDGTLYAVQGRGRYCGVCEARVFGDVHYCSGTCQAAARALVDAQDAFQRRASLDNHAAVAAAVAALDLLRSGGAA
jgi:hypothetical protein